MFTRLRPEHETTALRATTRNPDHNPRRPIREPETRRERGDRAEELGRVRDADDPRPHLLDAYWHRIDRATAPRNGVYLVFEIGELGHGGDRIVRVGALYGEPLTKDELAALSLRNAR